MTSSKDTADGKLRVRAGARLHLGLLDLTGDTGRLYGGIGCMLEAPSVEILATKSLEVEVVGESLDHETALYIETAARQAVEKLGAKPTRLEVLKALPAHAGFGSRTATTLATLAVVARLSGAEASPQRLIELSGRGGASGTGVHGFFRGGWIVDAGQPAVGPALPSRMSRPVAPSLLVSRISPPDWPVGLFLTRATSVSGQDEADFFQAHAQRAGMDAAHCVATAHHKLVPGLLTADMALFGEGVRDLHDCGFKVLELQNQPDAVARLIDDLRRVSPIVGMSSMGPLVYAIGGNSTQWGAVAAQHEAWHTQTVVSAEPSEFTWLS